MPSRTKKVRFETEYNSSFKAFDEDVYRSPLIEAVVNEPLVAKTVYNKNENIAGLQSHKFSKLAEPPLQHKRCVLDNMEQPNIENIKDGKKKNRALEFKAGLRPESSMTKKKHPVSEYKKQYEWKKSPNDSPLLNAEKIVFESHTNIPRFVRDKVPKRTEYQSKFAAGKHKKLKQKETEENETMKDENEVIPSSTVKRFLKTSQNPDAPFFPHASCRYHTEYQANFGSPKKYKYQEGIWLGAKPPHLLPDDESTQETNEGLPNWFEEVLELRAKAKHYKIRAFEGNYFSRGFLEKLDAELERIYGEHSDSNDSRNSGKRFGEGGLTKQSDNVVVPRSVPVRQAWESGTSNTDNDGRKVYKDLNEQFKRASSGNETLSSHSDDEHLDDDVSVERGARLTGNEKDTDKRHVGKRFTNKPSAPLPRTSQRNSPLQLQENTSGSDASSERSEGSSVANSVNSMKRILKTQKPTARKTVNPDRFNIATIQGIQSNDLEVLSWSVQSNYGSEDSEKLSKNDKQSDCMSESSFASRDCLARQTLSHAKQRDDKFWKK